MRASVKTILILFGLLAFSGIAHAAKPTITTNAATALTTTGATLNGTVSSNGSITTVTFNYGLTTAYGSTVTATQSPLAAAASNVAVSASLTGLTCGTTYHFRASGVNGSGTTNGGDQTFTTSACPFACTPPSNTPAGLTLTCQCDTFQRATLNPSTIFNSNWIISSSGTTSYVPNITNPGYMRLTDNNGNEATASTVPGIFPATGNYISVEFQHYAYNGSGADGIAVTLSDYAVPAVPGAFGGSLGYAQKTGINGFAGGWIGLGLDEYGNYENSSEGRIGGVCTPQGCSTLYPQSVGIRGSGSGTAGYNWLQGNTSAGSIADPGSTTPAYGYLYQIIVDARNDPASTTVSINRDTTGTGNSYASLISIPNVYTAATAQGFTQSAVPTNWQISFTGSTGGSTDIHEIGNLRICASVIVPVTGGTAGSFNAIDSAYGTPPVAVQNYLTGHIYTKLVGTPFKLDVAALSNGQIVTTYAASSNKTVTVNLVDNSDSLTIPANDCTLSCTSTCTSKAAVTGGTQTLTFASGATDKGQKQSPSFTINSAFQKLVAIISDGTTTACSTDSFSVRPLSVASVVSSNATNITTTGTPIFGAGSGNFSLTATTTGVAGSPSNYTGVLKINSSLVTAASPATVNGILTGTFPAATSGTPSSTATGTTFTYSEVGAFTLPVNSVYEGVVTAVDCLGMTTAQCDAVKSTTWTGVDSISTRNDCNADSFSNAIDGAGKFGCNFGLIAAGTFGRFVPDHFNTITSGGMPCPTGQTCPVVYNGFVYSGQAFTTQVTALNAGGSTTLNYDTTKGLSKAVTLTAWNASGGATQNPGGGNLTLNTMPSTAFSAGVATTTTPIYTFSVSPTAPTNIYVRAIDTDNVTSLRGVSSIEGGMMIVSGRMVINSVYGSEFLNLSVPAAAQYWGGATGWAISSTDSTSSFSKSDVNFSNWQATGGTWNIGSTSVVTPPSTVAFVNGLASFTLKNPGYGNTGSVDLTANGTGTSPSTNAYLPSNTARITFGVFKENSRIIYFREN